MEELQLTLTPSRVDQRNYGTMLTNWRVGQTLNALVSDRMPDGNLILVVSGQKFITSQDIPVQPGTRVSLEIQQLQPRLVLKFVEVDNLVLRNKAAGSDSLQNPISSSQGFATLVAALRANSSLIQSASDMDVDGLIKALQETFLKFENLNHSQVRNVFNVSGVFTEALWFANKVDLATRSSKTILLSLREAVLVALRSPNLQLFERDALRRVLTNVEALLLNTTRKQIASIPQENGQSKWLATLPLQWSDKLIHIDVELRRHHKELVTADSDWQLFLSIELEKLGVIKISLAMLKERLQVEFQVNGDVTKFFLKSLPALRSQMVTAGLNVDDIKAKPISKNYDASSSGPFKGIDVSI